MNEFIKQAEKTVALLMQSGLTLATAESCTGGIISSAITSISGASKVFELGLTTYSSRVKNEILGVNSDTLSEHGAISRQTAREMAKKVRRLAGSDIGVSVTGVAGPDPCEGKSVGTVYIAIADHAQVAVNKLSITNADRSQVRLAASMAVLKLIENYIKERNQ